MRPNPLAHSHPSSLIPRPWSEANDADHAAVLENDTSRRTLLRPLQAQEIPSELRAGVLSAPGCGASGDTAAGACQQSQAVRVGGPAPALTPSPPRASDAGYP